MRAEKEFIFELIGFLILGTVFIAIIIILIGMFGMQVRLPQIPNF